MKAAKALLLCVLLLSSNLITKDSQAKTYNFVAAEFPRIAQLDQSGALEGLGVELTQEIFKRLNKKVNIQIFPLKRALFLLKNKKADVMIGPYISKERSAYMNYNNIMLYNDEIQFYKLNTNPFTWDGNLTSLKGQKIGIINGWEVGSEFKNFKDSLNITQVKSVEQAFKMLKHKRLDLVICHNRASSPVIKRLGIKDQVSHISPILTNKAGYFASSKSPENKEFFELFDKAFKDLVEDGTFERLSKKWLN